MLFVRGAEPESECAAPSACGRPASRLCAPALACVLRGRAQKLAVENFQLLRRLKRASSKPTFDTWSQQDHLKEHLKHNKEKVRQLRLEAVVADNFKLVSRLANAAVRATTCI